jgi:hypothetical protein
MKISLDLKICYPGLADWIASEIPKYRTEKRVFEAFKLYAQLDDSGGSKALGNNGLPPTIDVRLLGDTYGAYLGETKRAELNRRLVDRVFIGRKLCREWSKLKPDLRWGTEWDRVMRGTILHEMVHWGDFVADGQAQPDARVWDSLSDDWYDDGDGDAFSDVGFQFEEAAFGAIWTRRHVLWH